MKYDKKWVELLAEQLVIDVSDWMAGVHLVCVPEKEQSCAGADIHAVCACAKGDASITMQLQAEPRLFSGLAKRHMGKEPTEDEDIQEYAVEFMNVLCGRFVSALCTDMKIKICFSTPSYDASPKAEPPEKDGESSTLVFFSKEYGHVVFKWTVKML